MLTRIISGIIGILLLIGIAFLPQPFFYVLITVLTLIGLNEFFNVMKIKFVSIKLLGFITSFIVLFLYSYENIFYYSIYILILGMFLLVIADYNNKSLNDIYGTLLGVLFVSFMFSHVIKVYNLPNGNILIWLIFLSAFATDTFAYFVGVLIGKHKLTKVSPKKTIEGSIGGFFGSIIIITIFGYIINRYFDFDFAIYNYLILGALGGIIGQIGDLSASLIKRATDAKDYGKIMPGHGGVIDRFDSVLFIAPIVYYYLYFFTNI